MKIVGAEGLTNAQMQEELQRGARFVIYQYAISVVVMSFRRPSNIYFIRAGQRSMTTGLGFPAVSLLFGWWGIPWGPIYTIQSLWNNFNGGRDVTSEVLASSSASQSIPQARRA
jgi:hypothetical protein